MSFVITCCMILFLKTLQQSLDIRFTEANIRSAAVLTFGNVLFLSLLCIVIDGVRRKFMVERPVRRIVPGAEKLMQGDFSARIEPYHGINERSGFDTIKFGGNDDPQFRQVMIGATGGGVCTIVIGMAIHMIWRATKNLKKE